MRSIHASKNTQAIESFFDSIFSKAETGNALDSVSARSEFAKSEAKSYAKEDLPASVAALMAELGDDESHRVLDSVVLGMKVFKQKNGVLPTGDVVENAIHQALSLTDKAYKARGEKIPALDSAGNSDHHDQISSQPNRAVVAIVASIAEAIPFATYLPADIGSNESRLVIVSHQAGTTTGAYTAGDLLDGINAGDEYVSSERRVAVTLGGGNTTGAAAIDAVVGGPGPVAVLRGRTQVYINGLLAAGENPNVSSSVANSPISGTINIGGTDYTVGGTVTVATGVVALTFSPALPGTPVVEVEGYIDYEVDPTLAPKVITQAQNYPLYASAWRGIVKQTIDTQTQYANEIGVDMQSEGLVTVRAQTAMERHYMALKKVKTIAVNNGNVETFDFDAVTQLAQKTRSQIIQDILVKMGVISQRMAEDTMEYGMKFAYTGKSVLALFMSLPESVFKPSGIMPRPSIYWAGTLANGVEVYYTPKHLTDSASTGQILCIGRSMNVARSPIVLGDAVAPTYRTLSVNEDLKSGVAFYARNFTAVNPHTPSALGCGLINVTNIG